MISQKQKIMFIIKTLEKLYPNANCSLNFKKPYEFLVAVRLSAQCTDKRVNQVCCKLFSKFKSIEEISKANFDEIYKIVRPCGMGLKKANDVINICKNLIKNFNSIIPNDLNNLMSLPGVGRKTANLVLATVYNIPTVVVDTHVLRISKRLGLTNSQNPKKVEFDLLDKIPLSETNKLCHRIIQFGREICRARNPKCDRCVFKNICPNTK